MNAVAEFIERLAIGAQPAPADERLVEFGNRQHLTRRNLTESVLILAGTNKGKTTLGRTLYRALLRDRQGGLVLCVKESQIEEFRAVCEREERLRDSIVLNPGSRHSFNPLLRESSSAEAAALVSELAEVLAERVRDGGENDAFWRAQLSIILRNLFVLCRLAYDRHDWLLAAELFDGRANSMAELDDPQWRQRSPLAAALTLARKRDNDSNARLAVEYFTRTYPTHGDRLQGSLAATVTSVFDHLRRSPLRELFAGESTFTMDDLFEHGKICVVGLPTLNSAEGRIANAIMQFCFCRAATRRARKHYSFLISDECQETVSRELMRKLAVLREFKVTSVMLSQNLAVLDDRIGETAREGFCGLLGLKIFGPQGHAATRQWAAEQIGKRKVTVETKTIGRNHSRDGGRTTSTSVHEQWDYRVPPSRFAELQVGETICLRDGRVWLARWHKDMPGKRGTVGIV
ncbi:MAG: type IV secretory system conjugative DNA transfer family protein [Opitutae bacterium]|nr:type IV secretory system conjugative DNA transfer family protein [Opitutae bacterium]